MCESISENAAGHHRRCPWWLGYVLANPIRRLWQDPARILEPYVRAGMTVFEPGPGMGFFTLELARRVGPAGRVVAVDIQPKMLERLRRRLAKAGLLERVDIRLGECDSKELKDLAGAADLVLAFAVVHELPSAQAFFEQAARCLKPGGTLLLAEPAGHVSEAEFAGEIALAESAGLRTGDRLTISRIRAVVFQRS
jgi:ubiquinone/menaquinone biosynthesis C-methylase UbiE